MLRTVLLLLGLLAPLFPTAADDIPRSSAKPQVTIFGEVGKPGTYRLRAGATLLDALAKAGNLTSRATRTQLQLFRPDQPQPTAIDYQRLVKEDPAQNPPLQDGDVVYVPAEGGVIHLSPSLPEERGMLITVLGAVGTPGVLRMPRGATLLDLIAAAGNFRETAARTEFQIARRGKAELIVIDYKRLLKGHPTQNVKLEPGDVVYVPSDSTQPRRMPVPQRQRRRDPLPPSRAV